MTLDAAVAASTTPGSVRGSEGNKAEWWSRKPQAFPPPRTDALIQTHMHRLHSVTATQFCVHPKTPVALLSRSLSLEDRPTFLRLCMSIVECVLPWDWYTGPQGFLVTFFSQFLHRERHLGGLMGVPCSVDWAGT